MKRALTAAAVAAATLTALLPAQAASASPSPVFTTKSIVCAVRSANTWNGCTNDNAKVARGKPVYLALNSSSGRRVQFRLKNHRTGRVIATRTILLTPNGVRHLVWKNTTRAAVTLDVEARTIGATTVRAKLSVRR